MLYPKLSESFVVQRLAPPTGKIHIVLDTDTFNEIDDQFAVAYSLLSNERMDVEALYAAPFFNELSSSPGDGMTKSYNEILKIRKLLKREDVPAYRGSEQYLPGAELPVESDAVHDLIKRAMQRDADDPLYVVAIGAITNVASAILTEPGIIEKIVVVWLGGHTLEWGDTREFNLFQDLHASRVIMDSGVPLVLIPCMGVASNLRTTLSEIRDYVQPEGELGQYLYETYRDCTNDHYAYSRVIWDISTIAWLNNPNWAPSQLLPSPRISEDFRWSSDPSRHLIRYVRYIDRDAVFKDLFLKIKQFR
ncbi:nucleoside hydrolase [Paenibacillus sp. JDR-2]|uniref:nucleoside hydrolase n=1 Tax=Paenibacillus sp. (strain JDR-2) TaxID=324057 RepID=UPI0001AAF873|nr:nucleoside hydrolase [Paenibacillus sp. JDR-2]ACT02210.1 Inosine/uridine-preferring nucleoside hydrolase [Paenibacillus sp. JDR-2]